MTKQYKTKPNHFDDNAYQYSEPRKDFRRNKIDGVLGGVCSGISDYTGIDLVIVRVLTVIFLLMAGPIALMIYVGLWMFAPSDNRAPYRREDRQARRARRRHREGPSEPEIRPTASYRTVRGKFSSLEQRLQDLERSITSSEWQLRRDFRDLES